MVRHQQRDAMLSRSSAEPGIWFWHQARERR